MQPDAESEIFSAIFAAIFAFYFVTAIMGYLLFSWFLARVFRKAGIQSWKAWIPFYSHWIVLELGGQAGWLILLALVPGASIVATVFLFIAIYNVGAGFDRPGAGWLVLFIFLPIVWLGIIAFGPANWDASRMSVEPRYGANIARPGAAVA